jgi:hypothetical protein
MRILGKKKKENVRMPLLKPQGNSFPFLLPSVSQLVLVVFSLCSYSSSTMRILRGEHSHTVSRCPEHSPVSQVMVDHIGIINIIFYILI